MYLGNATSSTHMLNCYHYEGTEYPRNNLIYYATTVTVPAAVPILAALVIVALVPCTSLIVPEFNANGFAPKTNTSSAFVAALAAPIANENTNSLVPVPLAYAKA